MFRLSSRRATAFNPQSIRQLPTTPFLQSQPNQKRTTENFFIERSHLLNPRFPSNAPQSSPSSPSSSSSPSAADNNSRRVAQRYRAALHASRALDQLEANGGYVLTDEMIHRVMDLNDGAAAHTSVAKWIEKLGREGRSPVPLAVLTQATRSLQQCRRFLGEAPLNGTFSSSSSGKGNATAEPSLVLPLQQPVRSSRGLGPQGSYAKETLFDPIWRALPALGLRVEEERLAGRELEDTNRKDTVDEEGGDSELVSSSDSLEEEEARLQVEWMWRLYGAQPSFPEIYLSLWFEVASVVADLYDAELIQACKYHFIRTFLSSNSSDPNAHRYELDCARWCDKGSSVTPDKFRQIGCQILSLLYYGERAAGIRAFEAGAPPPPLHKANRQHGFSVPRDDRIILEFLQSVPHHEATDALLYVVAAVPGIDPSHRACVPQTPLLGATTQLEWDLVRALKCSNEWDLESTQQWFQKSSEFLRTTTNNSPPDEATTTAVAALVTELLSHSVRRTLSSHSSGPPTEASVATAVQLLKAYESQFLAPLVEAQLLQSSTLPLHAAVHLVMLFLHVRSLLRTAEATGPAESQLQTDAAAALLKEMTRLTRVVVVPAFLLQPVTVGDIYSCALLLFTQTGEWAATLTMLQRLHQARGGADETPNSSGAADANEGGRDHNNGGAVAKMLNSESIRLNLFTELFQEARDAGQVNVCLELRNMRDLLFY